MKIKHRIPVDRLRLTEPVTAEYQAEVDAALRRAEARERRAEQRLDAAERKLRHVQGSRHSTRREREVAAELVEMRRQELLAVQRMMCATAAGAQHRPRDFHRPVPDMKVM